MRPPPVSRRAHAALLLSVLGLLVAGCTGGVGHPIRTSLPRLPADAYPAPSPEGLPEPPPLDEPDALDVVFRDQPAILTALKRLRARPQPRGQAPVLVELPVVEGALARRYRRGGPAGPVRYVTALGTLGVLPMTPTEAADYIEDPNVEKAVLWADTFRPTGVVHDVPGHSRRSFWVDLLKRGEGPFRFDLRFGLYSERLTLPSGTVLIRFDPVLKPRPQIVTMYRGGVLLEAVPGGTRVTEVLAFGNSLTVPPPVWKLLRGMVYKTQKSRSSNLWERAWKARSGK